MKSVEAVPEFRPGDGPSDGIFYTNRCGNSKAAGCNRFITKLEIIAKKGDDPGPICPCGSYDFRSNNAKWWEELLLFRSWRLWWAIRTKAIPPPPDLDYMRNMSNNLVATVASLEDDILDAEDLEEMDELEIM